MPEETNIYKYGFDKKLYRLSGDEVTQGTNPTVYNAILDAISPSLLSAGATVAELIVADGGIQSSNYVAGSAGWIINYDGNAEFVSAKLKFLVKRDGKKSKSFTVEIKPPENSKIPQKKEKQIIEDYLKEQGVLLE